MLILGASARAAAAAVSRGGDTPIAVDLFADADTRRLCECFPCATADYPSELFEVAAKIPRIDWWMYTGGLENHTELVGRLAESRPLRGNGPEVLKIVRDPFALSKLFDEIDIEHPRIEREAKNGKWLMKPMRGSGGGEIRFADSSTCEDGYFFQEFIAGRSVSTVYLSTEDGCELLGTTRQLVGETWLHAGPFQYSGSVGPLDPSEYDVRIFERVGGELTRLAGLRWVWGIDWIETSEGAVPIEVNPRFPASYEILELARGLCLTANSANKTNGKKRDQGTARPNLYLGKAIYYAPSRIVFPSHGPWEADLNLAADAWRMPNFADIPNVGDVIEAGRPILTIFTCADDEDSCIEILKERADELDRLFSPHRSSHVQNE